MQKNLAFLIVKINKIWYNIQSKQYKNEASDMLTDTGQNMHFCFCDNSIWIKRAAAVCFDTVAAPYIKRGEFYEDAKKIRRLAVVVDHPIRVLHHRPV